MKAKVLESAALMLAILSSCREAKSAHDSTPFDYSVESNWMLKDNDMAHDVDLFYIYPTITCRGESPAMELDEKEKESAYHAYLLQAGCMEEFTNVYVPYYRQATFDFATRLGTAEALVDTLRRNIGKQDIFAALDYYFDNINNGRPFILASHSQGSAMMRIVFDEYMPGHKEYLDRMIVAYTLGFSCPKKWMAEYGLKGAMGPDDTGVIVAWNTEGPNPPRRSMIVTSDDYVINPLTWTTDTAKADVSMNLGSFEWDDAAAGKYHIGKGRCDARVDNTRAALVCTTCKDYESTEAFGGRSLHEEDWKGYYANIKENARVRIDAYSRRPPSSVLQRRNK